MAGDGGELEVIGEVRVGDDWCELMSWKTESRFVGIYLGSGKLCHHWKCVC